MNDPFSCLRIIRRFATLFSLAVITAATAAAQAQFPSFSPTRRGPPEPNTRFQASLQFTRGIDISIQGRPFNFTGFPALPEDGEAINRNYGNGFVGVDFLGNADGLTGLWGFLTDDQVDIENDRISFSSFGYGNENEYDHRDDANGLAIDLSLNRTLFRPARGLAVGLQGGFQIGPLDASGAFLQTVPLIQVTDTYSLNGFQPPSGPFVAGPTQDAQGNPFPAPRIGSQPLGRTISFLDQTSDLITRYDVSGGYYNFRLGPMIDFRPAEWFAVQLSAGASVIFASAEFNYNETFTPPDGSGTLGVHDVARSDKYLKGYYGEMSLQFWLTRRAGLFVSGVMHKTESMSMRTQNQAASVDFGSTSSFGFGLHYSF